MPGALLVVNPRASRVTPALVEAVVRELAAAGPLETALTERPGHATALVAAACRTHEAVFVLSGDGGYNEAANGASGDVPIGFLPGGATNVLPRALGLPRDPVACARRLARSARVRRISVGRAVYWAPTTPPPDPLDRWAPTTPPPDPLDRWAPTTPPPDPLDRSRRFTFGAGVGLDAELVRAVDRRGRSSGRRPADPAFVWELAALLARGRGHLGPALTVDGVGRCAFALVANGDPYSYFGPLPVRAAPEARFELGLDLVAPARVRPHDLARLAWWALARPGGQTRAPDVLYVHDADRLHIVCDRPTPLQVDGEDLGDATEVRFEAERGALCVLS